MYVLTCLLLSWHNILKKNVVAGKIDIREDKGTHNVSLKFLIAGKTCWCSNFLINRENVHGNTTNEYKARLSKLTMQATQAYN